MFTARYVLHSTFCPHSVFMCFVWIWEQTAIISLYSIDWLVLITETECVYCAVRSTFYVLPTQGICVFCVDLRTNSDYFTVQHWLVGSCNLDGVCLLRSTDGVFNYKVYFSGMTVRYIARHTAIFVPFALRKALSCSILICMIFTCHTSRLHLHLSLRR